MKKDLLAVLFVILLIAAAVNGTHIQSVDEYYLTHIDDITGGQRDSDHQHPLRHRAGKLRRSGRIPAVGGSRPAGR